MNEKVTKLAIASRLILLAIQLISDILIPDHKPDVFKSPKSTNGTELFDSLATFLFGGLRRWDAEYFLHISEHGYSYENTLAFYPLYPGMISILTKLFLAGPFQASFQSIALVVAVSLNVYFFYRAANCLYDLTQKIFGDLNKSWNAVVLFCFNPASIFFCAPYSEGLFCWLTFSLMLECATNLPLIKTTVTLSLSMLCRSNGFVNMGFPIYFIFRKILLKKSFLPIFKLIGIILLALIPLTFYNFYIFRQFCSENAVTIDHSPSIVSYAKERDYVLAGSRNYSNSLWCDDSFPFPYSYVQNHYWNVGFLKYYEFKQIPNFLLAAPILIFILSQSFRYYRELLYFIRNNGVLNAIIQWKSFPFILHALFLTCFSIAFVHIQISTRLIASSTPCLYWFAADFLPKTFDQVRLKSKSSNILYWFGGYFIVGTILFSNYLPWT